MEARATEGAMDHRPKSHPLHQNETEAVTFLVVSHEILLIRAITVEPIEVLPIRLPLIPIPIV